EDSTQFVVKVEAGKNLLSLIKTEVVGDELRIRNDNKCNFVRRYDIPVKVYVTMPRILNRIKSKGTGLISNTNVCTSDSIDFDVESSGDIDFLVQTINCNIHQHGAGDVTVRGQADQVIVYCIGTGFVTTDACPSAYSWVYSKGTGKITVAPRDLFIVQLDGPGSAYYRGQPELWSTVNGTGGVFQLP
ncbi:MAG: GIN domain-containing protein, partial [Bacteroidia bacterium]